ncbi:MAG TPA: bifunctional DNA-binding transcriptional regulator/O6-methylguanine-DNA methyltransferase Ada [Bryobacteraceae bacterium]|jgi:AraC family transcriptional regulator of adaptative response/methylated-DNA-[protein]-cysteine methyltransferase
MLDKEKCWNAVLNRNAAEDGRFFFGVLTTGVYCRPSCHARKPLRKNVRFYETPAEAERDGLRPCLRCRPLAERADEPTLQKIRQVCDYLRRNCESGEELTLAKLGELVGLSLFHLQRTFKAVLGVTPKQYLEACRIAVLKTQLRKSESVTNAVYEAGFGSSSRVYERVDSRLGMTPSEYRAGGKGAAISYAFAETQLGRVLLGATDRGLCFLQFGESRDELLASLKREYPQASLEEMKEPKSPQFELWTESLARYLRGDRTSLDLPVSVRATAFQAKVWRYLQSIPAGEVRSYSEVAAAIGEPRAMRAVGRACASNRVAIVIPCHRVIRGDLGLGGYRWGVDRKRRLLDQEKVNRVNAKR